MNPEKRPYLITFRDSTPPRSVMAYSSDDAREHVSEDDRPWIADVVAE